MQRFFIFLVRVFLYSKQFKKDGQPTKCVRLAKPFLPSTRPLPLPPAPPWSPTTLPLLPLPLLPTSPSPTQPPPTSPPPMKRCPGPTPTNTVWPTSTPAPTSTPTSRPTERPSQGHTRCTCPTGAFRWDLYIPTPAKSMFISRAGTASLNGVIKVFERNQPRHFRTHCYLFPISKPCFQSRNYSRVHLNSDQ